MYNNTCSHQKATLTDKSCQTFAGDIEDTQTDTAQEVLMESEDILTCTLCSKTFESTDHLEAHLETVHDQASHSPTTDSSSEKEVNEDMHDRTCDYCDDNFLSPILLQEHISERHAIAYLQCHSCMLRFQTKLQLRTHVKTCHEPPSGSITGIGASSTTSAAEAGPSTSFSSSIQSSAASESKNL